MRRRSTRATVIGVISDTHGLLRPEALAALAGVDRIVHAGDIGSAAVLDALRRSRGAPRCRCLPSASKGPPRRPRSSGALTPLVRRTQYRPTDPGGHR